jgi:hypothetical protein
MDTIENVTVSLGEVTNAGTIVIDKNLALIFNRRGRNEFILLLFLFTVRSPLLN